MKKFLPIIEDYYTKGTFLEVQYQTSVKWDYSWLQLIKCECAGLSNEFMGLFVKKLERGDSAISCVSVQGFNNDPIHAFGTEDRRTNIQQNG